jgi:aminopeptidase N
VKYGSRTLIIPILSFFIFCTGDAQPLSNKDKFTRQDTLRGSLNAERNWWNVLHYNILVEPDYKTKTIRGKTEITFAVTNIAQKKKMQIDLQQPLAIDSVLISNNSGFTRLPFLRDGNIYFIDFGNYKLKEARTDIYKTGSKELPSYSITIYYQGKPREAIRAPWDGGWIFGKDAKGRPWMTVACQGLGASVWYPCKDHQSDEPDKGARLQIIVPDTVTAVANGRLLKKKSLPDSKTLFAWQVENPINNYNIVPYIGRYVNYTDTLMGEKGKLDLSYWVLDYNLEKAKKQFGRDVKRMLHAFEYWFGPYPFYEDDFKLIESPHLGMEHQSGIAYGNKFLNGYLGGDLSGSGWGLKWDYIIVHEAGHEWFGNNITTNDIADMWVHEGFTMYSEVLFIEYYYGKKAADEYVQGLRSRISNDIPLIGPYGVNQEGSGDMYNKGANLIHTIRQVIDNDSVFRKIMRGLNKDFWHKTTTSKEVEAYISKHSGKDFSKVFDQYLRTISIPVFEYRIKGKSFEFRWANCIKGFIMPVKIKSGDTWRWITPAEKWTKLTTGGWFNKNSFIVSGNFYITARELK